MTRSADWSRRSFVRRAVAVGGVAALAACLDREDAAGVDLSTASTDPADLPTRQHAWNEFLEADEHGNVRPPENHVFLLLEYVGGGPDDDEREAVEAAFTTLERAFERGAEGLSFTVGYSPAYFDRFETDLPDSVDLPEPDSLSPIEDPEFDAYDALVHLASDYGQAVLGAEEALTGELDELNGVDVTGSLDGSFVVGERREGFVGDALPAEKAGEADLQGMPDPDLIPDDAPFFMGFVSGLARNQASEDRVTIETGPFAGGTTTHLSKIRLNLRQWYLQDSREERVTKTFSPAHVDDDLVEGAGHNLGDSSGVDDDPDTVLEDARIHGMVGHAQKAARAREDGEPIILRRDVNTIDDGRPGVHFLAHQRTISDFVTVREAMNGTDLVGEGSIGSRTHNGILQYLNVSRRGNYLVPPREQRSLPVPNPD